MKIGFYAGSFDPFTIGHLHIVKVASRIFDKVIVGIGVNPKKTRRFDKIKMKNAIEKLLKSENVDNFEVITFDGLTADIASEYNTNFLIRGVRNGIDYDFEENLALINEEIAGIDTIYIRAGEFGAVSSSMVYELLKRNKDVSKYIPKYIIDVIKEWKIKKIKYAFENRKSLKFEYYFNINFLDTFYKIFRQFWAKIYISWH